MQVKYIGPKAVISEHGISFKDGKEDKYVYINHAINIFNAINHEYDKHTVYNHTLENKEYSSTEVFTLLKENLKNFESLLNAELAGYAIYLQAQENEVANRTHLSPEEKSTFINNLKIMKPYRQQRFINKHIYEHIIQAIANTIVNNQLKEINTPFNERFWHILQTIEGWLLSEHNIQSTLDTLLDQDENLIITLHINTIY